MFPGVVERSKIQTFDSPSLNYIRDLEYAFSDIFSNNSVLYREILTKTLRHFRNFQCISKLLNFRCLGFYHNVSYFLKTDIFRKFITQKLIQTREFH